MAETLLNEHSHKISSVTLIPSSGGVYEITYGDNLIYSKKETGSFPDPDTIVSAVGGD